MYEKEFPFVEYTLSIQNKQSNKVILHPTVPKKILTWTWKHRVMAP